MSTVGRMLSGLRVRLGYGAGTALTSVAQVEEEAVWASGAGFESFWVSQVFGVDPIVALAAIGNAVPTLREMGTSVVPLPGRHPLALAAQARTAQSALDGRFTLGVGTSHQMVSEGFLGESYDRPFSRASEFLDALIPLLNGEPADVAGSQVFAKGWLTIGADLILAGSIDDIVEGLSRYVDAGATDLRVMIAAGNDDERLATREALAGALAAQGTPCPRSASGRQDGPSPSGSARIGS